MQTQLVIFEELLKVVKDLRDQLATLHSYCNEKGYHLSNERVNMTSACLARAGRWIDKVERNPQ